MRLRYTHSQRFTFRTLPWRRIFLLSVYEIHEISNFGTDGRLGVRFGGRQDGMDLTHAS